MDAKMEQASPARPETSDEVADRIRKHLEARSAIFGPAPLPMPSPDQAFRRSVAAALFVEFNRIGGLASSGRELAMLATGRADELLRSVLSLESAEATGPRAIPEE